MNDPLEAAEMREMMLSAASEQLEAAIELFLDRELYFSALTLAGAAEAIFERLVKISGAKSALEEEFRTFDEMNRLYPKFFQFYAVELPENKRLAVFRNHKHHSQNFAKHGPENYRQKLKYRTNVIAPSVKDAAHETLIRAAANRDKLDLEPTELMSRFELWSYREIVGDP